MMMTDDWINDLPPLLRPEHRRFLVEAVSPEAKAFCRDLRSRVLLAQASAQAFGAAKGARGYWPPSVPSQCNTASMFAFDEKPTATGWKVIKRLARDTVYKAVAAKTPEGVTLAAEMATCVPFPDSEHELVEHLLLLTYFQYGDEDQEVQGFTSIGSFDPVSLYWTEDRFFASCANPFPVLQNIIEQHPDVTITPGVYGNHYAGDAREWRPPEGWDLISQAEVDLVYAQAKVDAERATKVA